MLENLNMEIFYPHPPQKVWQAIANKKALAKWLMDNDFEPKIGHIFRFVPDNKDEFDGIIYCEVIELEEEKRLSYTWRSKRMSKATIVTWELVAVAGGTQLKLGHKGFENKIKQPLEVFQRASNNFFTPRASLGSINPRIKLNLGYAETEKIDIVAFHLYRDLVWHSAINQLEKSLNEVPQKCPEYLTLKLTR